MVSLKHEGMAKLVRDCPAFAAELRAVAGERDRRLVAAGGRLSHWYGVLPYAAAHCGVHALFAHVGPSAMHSIVKAEHVPRRNHLPGYGRSRRERRGPRCAAPALPSEA